MSWPATLSFVPDYSPDSAWPPLPPAITRSWDAWSAWYVGTPERLTAHYGAPESPRVRPAQLSGGIVGQAARMLWGQPHLPTLRHRIHLPVAHDICTASADMLFGEELRIESKQDTEALQDTLDGNNLQSLLLEAAELAAAYGSTYLRIGWDRAVADHALVTAVPATRVVPTWRYGRLVEATVWQVLEDRGGLVLRHLEHHTPGAVRHELRQGTHDRLGTVIPLTDHEATANLPGEGTIATGFERLTVVHVPNVRPAPEWIEVPEAGALGRADIGVGGVDTLMDALDFTWSSWLRDIRLGQARLMVSSGLLDDMGPGRGAAFDLDREVYEQVKFGQPQDSSLSDMVSPQQFALRVAEHAQTVEALIGSVVRNSGYSGSTFGLTTDAPKTATEINSYDARTAQTRERKTRYWANALSEAYKALSAVDAAQFSRPRVDDLKVLWPPDATASILELSQSLSAFRSAQAMSIETAVRWAQPDLDDEAVAEEVQRIMDETSSKAPDPQALLAGFDMGAEPTEPLTDDDAEE